MGSGSWLLAPIAGPAQDNGKCERKRASSDSTRGCSLASATPEPRPRSKVFPSAFTDIDHKNDQANRAISTSQLNASPRLHTWPINVVVFHGSQGRTRFKGGFPLRCLQRLSRPYIATLHCGWRHNSSTRGTSIPVLSY